MLPAVEPLRREFPGDLFLSIKEDNGARGIPNNCFKCKNIAEVAQTFKNIGLVTRRNNQVFTLSFNLVMSEFLLEKKSRRHNMQVSQRWQKLWKEWHFISQSTTQPAEVTCMVIVTTRITYCSQSKINSFNLFQGPYLKKWRLLGIHTLVSRDQVNHFGSKIIQNVLVLLVEEYCEKCLVGLGLGDNSITIIIAI